MLGITKQQQTKKPKQRTCKICREKFTADPNLFCPPTCEKSECRYEYAMKHLNKKITAVKKENNKAKKEFNQSDRKYLLELAQKAVNTFIRMRDGKYCISCEFVPHYDKKGVWKDRQFQAGHYKSQGGNSALRFDENNIHAQCSICNNHLSANLAKYRANIIKKIGIAEVERLETTKNTKLWTVEELQDIIKTYKMKIKELRLN